MPRTILVEGGPPPTGLTFSPDGATLAAGVKTVGAEVRLWRVSDGVLLRRFKSPKSTSALSGRLLARWRSPRRGGAERPVGDLRRPEREGTGSIRGRNPTWLQALSHTTSRWRSRPTAGRSRRSAAGKSSTSGTCATGQDRLATPEAHLGGVHALAFPPDGKTLISGSEDWTVRIWDLATGRPAKTLHHNGRVWSLAVSADGSFLAVGLASPYEVHLWNLETGERLHSWPIKGTSSESVKLRTATYGGDGSSVTIALADGSLRCWDLSTARERIIAQPNLPKPLDPAEAAKMLPVPHTARLAAFSRDGASKAIVRTIRGKSTKLADGTIRSDRASAGSMVVWIETQTGHVRREIEIPQADVQCLALSPDEQLIAVGDFSTLYPPGPGVHPHLPAAG